MTRYFFLTDDEERIARAALTQKTFVAAFCYSKKDLDESPEFAGLPAEVKEVVISNTANWPKWAFVVHKLPSGRYIVMAQEHMTGQWFAYPEKHDLMADAELLALAAEKTRSRSYWSISKEHHFMLQAVSVPFLVGAAMVLWAAGAEYLSNYFNDFGAKMTAIVILGLAVPGVFLWAYPIVIMFERYKLKASLENEGAASLSM